jgi:hypothetical protein
MREKHKRVDEEWDVPGLSFIHTVHMKVLPD